VESCDFGLRLSKTKIPPDHPLAAIALLVVNRDFCTTRSATVSVLLITHECLNPLKANLLEVCNRARPEVAAITLVKMPQPRARIVTALEAKLDLVLPQQFAMTFEESALLVPRPAPAAMGNAALLLGQCIQACKIARAGRAVESARRDELGFHSESSIRLVISPYASIRRSRRNGQFRLVSSITCKSTSPIRISSLSCEAFAIMRPNGSAINDPPQNSRPFP